MTQCLKNHIDIEDGAVCPRCGKRVTRIMGREFDAPEGPREVLTLRLSDREWNAPKAEDGEK